MHRYDYIILYYDIELHYYRKNNIQIENDYKVQIIMGLVKRYEAPGCQLFIKII